MNPTEPAHLTAKQLALYLGCEVEYKGEVATMYGVHTNQIMLSVVDHPHGEVCRSSEIKPLLRRLESMKGDESMELALGMKLQNADGYEGFKEEAERTAYLLSKHFDLFGWIDSGLALDQEAIKK